MVTKGAPAGALSRSNIVSDSMLRHIHMNADRKAIDSCKKMKTLAGFRQHWAEDPGKEA
jgi:hypothetical protein